MERTMTYLKLLGILIGIVMTILCLGYTNAYGITAPHFLMNNQNGGTNSTGLTSGGDITDEVRILGDRFNQDNLDGTNSTGDEKSPPSIPEPATLILLGTGLVGVKLFRRRH